LESAGGTLDITGAAADGGEGFSGHLRQAHEDPLWSGELSNGLDFKQVIAYRFRKTGHINVLELRNYKTFAKVAASAHAGSRVLALLDSRVSIGAAAKGRSSSPALTRVLQGTLGYVIGGGLQLGGIHTYSKDNRGDEPSRQRAMRGPSCALPVWLLLADAGDFSLFDEILFADQFTRPLARWLRFIFTARKLCLRPWHDNSRPLPLRGLRIGEASHPGPDSLWRDFDELVRLFGRTARCSMCERSYSCEGMICLRCRNAGVHHYCSRQCLSSHQNAEHCVSLDELAALEGRSAIDSDESLSTERDPDPRNVAPPPGLPPTQPPDRRPGQSWKDYVDENYLHTAHRKQTDQQRLADIKATLYPHEPCLPTGPLRQPLSPPVLSTHAGRDRSRSPTRSVRDSWMSMQIGLRAARRGPFAGIRIGEAKRPGPLSSLVFLFVLHCLWRSASAGERRSGPRSYT